MTGNKFDRFFQRVAAWCEATELIGYNSSLSLQSKGESRVELDGFSRYREAMLIDVA